MAIMATEVDPAGIMPGAILKATDFREARVLEIGAGDGRLTFQYAAEPRSVVAIDTKEPDIRAAGAPVWSFAEMCSSCAPAQPLCRFLRKSSGSSCWRLPCDE